ncbi:MAG: ParB/RepB/Spo0J family partition protein [Pseudomonadota bacterium]
MSKKRLGRGLDALLSAATDPIPAPEPGTQGGADAATGPREVPVEKITRSRFQPRRDFDDEALAELAASIKAQGLMQPVVVRPRPGGTFELIAGERRWRASQLAGMTHVPVVVKDANDEQASAMALIENIQREDLNPLEEAMALDRLREEFGLTQQQVAGTVGKSRVAVANLLRLLNLSPKVRDMLANGDLEMGHARALLSLAPLDQERAALEVIERSLSVRQTEALVRKLQAPKSSARPSAAGKSADTLVLERDLSEKIGAPVAIAQDAQGKGTLTIRFSTLAELDGVLAHIK